MELVNGKCIFSEDEFKNLLKAIFKMNRENQSIQDKMEDIGLAVTDGDLVSVFYCPTSVLEQIVPNAEEVAETTKLFWDFNWAQSFDEFYEKYFTERAFKQWQ